MVGCAKLGTHESAPSLPERWSRFARQVLGLAPCACAGLGALGLELGAAGLVELAGHIELAHRQLAAAAVHGQAAA